MEKQSWTSSDVRKFFKMDERYKSRQTLYNAEERMEIPKARRVPRGKVQIRHWDLQDIPYIGQKFGFLKKTNKQKVLCKYIQKGGVLKTTTSYNEARILALNGLKTLVVGQDFECSITDAILPKQEVYSLDKTETRLGLYHFIVEGAPINEVIYKTNIPTLDIIPETHDLVVLDKWLSSSVRREDVYKSRLMPYLADYDVIIFDSGPSWNHLIENSISCSHAVISPLGCNLLSYNASETNLATIFEFQDTMKLYNQKLIMFGTLLERSSLSQQIYAQYLSNFNDYIIPIPIRKSVKGEEALINQQSILEYAPNSSFAEDYYQLIKSIWEIVIDEENITDIQRNMVTIEGE